MYRNIYEKIFIKKIIFKILTLITFATELNLFCNHLCHKELNILVLYKSCNLSNHKFHLHHLLQNRYKNFLYLCLVCIFRDSK